MRRRRAPGKKLNPNSPMHLPLNDGNEGERSLSSPFLKKGGKQTKYDPKMCYILIDLMSRGMSKKEVAFELGIHPCTISSWVNAKEARPGPDENIPTFAYAVAIGELACEAWWHRMGRENLRNVRFNTPLYKAMLAVFFREPTDISEQKVSGHIGYGEKGIDIDISEFSTEELKMMMSVLSKVEKRKEGQGNSQGAYTENRTVH